MHDENNLKPTMKKNLITIAFLFLLTHQTQADIANFVMSSLVSFWPILPKHYTETKTNQESNDKSIEDTVESEYILVEKNDIKLAIQEALNDFYTFENSEQSPLIPKQKLKNIADATYQIDALNETPYKNVFVNEMTRNQGSAMKLYINNQAIHSTPDSKDRLNQLVKQYPMLKAYNLEAGFTVANTLVAYYKTHAVMFNSSQPADKQLGTESSRKIEINTNNGLVTSTLHVKNTETTNNTIINESTVEQIFDCNTKTVTRFRMID